MYISMDTYLLSEVIEKTGATARQIQHWAKIGILPHAKKIKPNCREYTPQDLRVIWTLVRVSSAFGGLPFNREFVEDICAAALLDYENVLYDGIRIEWGRIPYFQKGT